MMADTDGIRLTCPNGHKLRVKSALAGKRVRCPNKSCGAVVDVPSAETSEAQEPESRSINCLFPADQISNLPTWRFVLHFMSPIAFEPAILKRAIMKLKATDWKIITFPNGLDSLSLSEESNAVGVPVEVSEKLRRRPNSLADYESDFWKINFHMIDCGFGDLYYEAVDWKE